MLQDITGVGWSHHQHVCDTDLHLPPSNDAALHKAASLLRVIVDFLRGTPAALQFMRCVVSKQCGGPTACP